MSNEESRKKTLEIKDKESIENRIQDKDNDKCKTRGINNENNNCSPRKYVENVSQKLSDHPESLMIQSQDIENMQELLNEIDLPALKNTNSNSEGSHDKSGNHSIFYSCQTAMLNNELSKSSSSFEEIPNSNSESENENYPFEKLPNLSTHEKISSPNHQKRNFNEIDSDAETETFHSETEKSPAKKNMRTRANLFSMVSTAHYVLSISEAENTKGDSSPTKEKNNAETSEISLNDVTQCHNVSNEIEYCAEEMEGSSSIKIKSLIPDIPSPRGKRQNFEIPKADGSTSSDSEVEIKRYTQSRRRSGLTPKRRKIISNSCKHESPDALSENETKPASVKKTKASWDRDSDESEISDSGSSESSDVELDEEFDDGLDENMIGDEEDRARLERMTEKEKEQVICNRIEKREVLSKHFEIKKQLGLLKKKDQRKKKEKEGDKTK
ncbi:unnamed protein product, partial [Meganyctiphanes norvegica]